MSRCNNVQRQTTKRLYNVISGVRSVVMDGKCHSIHHGRSEEFMAAIDRSSHSQSLSLGSTATDTAAHVTEYDGCVACIVKPYDPFVRQWTFCFLHNCFSYYKSNL